MPCNLIIRGKNLDIDTFIAESKLRGYVKRHKGEPVFKSKPNGKKLVFSQIAKQTSTADFNNFDKQITDTITYLKRNLDKLRFINLTTDIDLALLDFGISLRIDHKETMFQTDRFPNELLKLASGIGLDIVLSIYPINS